MKRIILSLAVIVVVATAAVGATRAFFSDTETSTGNTFTAGTLDLGEEGFATFDLGTLEDMAPGDVTEEKVITILNDGSLPFAWFGNLVVTTENSNDKLKEALYIDYAKMEFKDNDGGTDWEPVDNFITDGRGSGLYPDWFNTLADSSPFLVNSLSVFDGNNGMGSAPYEFMGALNPGYSYRLTLKFGFAADADNSYQGDAAGVGPVTVSFEADAVQVNAGALDALQAGFGTNHLDWLNQQLNKQIN